MNTYDLTFSCSEVILSGGSAKVKADSLDEAKEKLEQALRAMDKSTEEVSYNYEYNNEYCDNSFQVDSIEEKEHKENGTEPNQDPIELKPCPFCGSKNIELSSEEYHDKDVFYIVSCNNCGAQIEGSGRNKEAAEAWNTRCE